MKLLRVQISLQAEKFIHVWQAGRTIMDSMCFGLSSCLLTGTEKIVYCERKPMCSCVESGDREVFCCTPHSFLWLFPFVVLVRNARWDCLPESNISSLIPSPVSESTSKRELCE